MKLDVTTTLPFPRDQVFAAYRDHMADMVPYLQNVRAITVKSRVDDGEVVRLVNHWKGGGEIPAVVRKFLSAELLEWDDIATWSSSKFTCEWQTVVPAFKEAVDARGVTTFVAQGNQTVVTIAGELKVDAGKVKGVPRLLSGTVSPAIEAFLVGSIKPNMTAQAKGVEKFLQQR